MQNCKIYCSLPKLQIGAKMQKSRKFCICTKSEMHAELQKCTPLNMVIIFHCFAESSSFMVKMASETIPVHQVLSIESYYIWEVPPKFKNLIFTAFFDIFLDFYRKSAETVLKALTGFTPPWHRQHFLLDFLIGSLDRRSSVHHSGKFCHQFKLSVTVFQRLLFFSENQFYRIPFYTWTFHAFRN